MENDRHVRVSSYCHHKASGQAIVTLDGRAFYLGKYRTRESRQAYNRLIAEWTANGRQLPSKAQDGLTLVELCARYKRFSVSRRSLHNCSVSTGRRISCHRSLSRSC